MPLEEAVVQQIVEAVIAQLQAGGGMPKRRKRAAGPTALLVVDATGPALEAALPAVTTLLNDTLASAVLVPSGRLSEAQITDLKTKLGLEEVWTPEAGCLRSKVAEVSIVVGVSLSASLLARTALLLVDDAAAEALLEGVFAGKPVVAALDGCDPEAAPVQLPARLFRRFQEYIADLDSYGMKLCAAADLSKQVLAALTGVATPGAASTPDLLTAEDVRRIADGGAKQLEISSRTIVTPLAQDLADERGLKLKISD